MLVLKIATTVWLIVTVLGVAGSALNQKTDTTAMLTCVEIILGQILAIAFMWQ